LMSKAEILLSVFRR